MKQRNQNSKRTGLRIALALALFLCSGYIAFAAIVPNRGYEEPARPGNEIQDLKEEKSEIEKSIEQTKIEYQEQVKLYSQQEQELASLQSKIMTQISTIEKTDLAIVAKVAEVDAKKLEVNKAQADVDNHVLALRKRLRAMYKFGKTGYLQLVLKSENVVSALTRIERVRLISNYDKQMLDELRFLKEKLEIKQKELEDEKKALENLKEEQTRQKEALETSYDQELVKKKQTYQNMEALERQKNQLEAESARITETLRQMQIKRDFVGGAMIWPLDYQNSLITSFFGPRIEPIPGSGANHGAIDIAAPMGSNIYAALGGEVIASEFMWGYGNAIMVDHGGGIVTLYAHANERWVSVGDMVNRGDVIGKVGSTGFSTGPHLHFEVRENGTRVDPLNYVGRP